MVRKGIGTPVPSTVSAPNRKLPNRLIVTGSRFTAADRLKAINRVEKKIRTRTSLEMVMNHTPVTGRRRTRHAADEGQGTVGSTDC